MQSIERELLLDIGNTRIKVGVWEEGRVKLLKTFETAKVLKEPKEFRELLKGSGSVAVACVVPEIERIIRESSKECFFVEKGLSRLPIDLKDYSGNLGADRIANMAGAAELFNSFITVSCGTATVIDVVVDKKFIGGVILPGLRLMAESLAERTSLLPSVKNFKRLELGLDTSSSIEGGVLFATVGAVREVKREWKGLPLVITGGSGRVISELVGGIYISELTLRGIWRIWRGRGLPR